MLTAPLLQRDFSAKRGRRVGRSTVILAADQRLSGEEVFIIIARGDTETSIHACPGHSTSYFAVLSFALPL